MEELKEDSTCTYIISLEEVRYNLVNILMKYVGEVSIVLNLSPIVAFELGVQLNGPPKDRVDHTGKFLSEFNIPTDIKRSIINAIEQTIHRSLIKSMGGVNSGHLYVLKRAIDCEFIIVDEGNWRDCDTSPSANRKRSLENRISTQVEDYDDDDVPSLWDAIFKEIED